MKKTRKAMIDPALLLAEIIQSDFDLTKFQQVDESAIVQPKNFLDWVVGRDFCNTSILPWQLEQGMKLFSDYCPECSNPEYLEGLFGQTLSELQDNICMLEDGVCPKCHKNRLELFTIYNFDSHKPSLKNEFIAATGQRSGKCLTASTLVMTPSGPIEIQNLKVGDTVYGYNKEGSVSPTQVLNVFDQGVQKVTSLSYCNHEVFACTDNHKWLFEREADGRHPERKRARFEGTIQDLKKGVMFSRTFVKIPGGSVHEPHAYNMGHLSAAKNYKVPIDVIKTWDRDSRLKFLAGLLDTNGSLHLAKNKSEKETSLCLRFNTQSKDLIDVFEYLVLGLFQFKMHLWIDNRVQYKNGPCYDLKTSSNFHILRLLEELDPYLVNPKRKLKEEYKKLPIRNSHPDYLKLTKGDTYEAQTYDIEVDNETSLFVLAEQGVITHNSKSIAIYTSYQLNRWLSLPDPLAYYGLPGMEIIMGTFSALSADQAEENLWIPFRGLYDQSPWFTKYNEFLKSEEKRLSIPLADIKETYIFYPHKRFMTSFTGSDDRKKRGRTRLWGVIDEIAFLNSDNTGAKKKVMDADKNYAALNNSLATIRQKVDRKLREGFYNTPTAIMHNASSPYNAMDKIMRLVKGAVNNPAAQVVHDSTWKLNPDYTEQSLRQQNASLSQVEFDRDFGAIPPFSDSPYIGEARIMERLCDPRVPKVMEAHPQVYIDPMGDRHLFLEAKIPRPDKMTPRLLSLDNGYKQNAFGATLFRYDSIQKKPVLEFAVSLYPQPEAGLNVHFPMMFENFILAMVKNFKIQNVFYDRWQSLDQIQRLRDMKIDARAHSLSYEKDFLPFRQQIISGNIILPECTIKVSEVKEAANPLALAASHPITNLIWQSLTVREAGKKILKPLEGDDDLFRAFALGGSRFLDEEIKKQYANNLGVLNNLAKTGVVGTYASNSGNNGNSMANNSNPESNRAYSYMRVRTTKR